MARFYASIQGNRGEATRIGSKDSGIEGHIRGWNIGGRVCCFVGENGEDRVQISLTGGSSCSFEKVIGTFTEADLTD